MKKLAFLFLTFISTIAFAKPMQVEVIGGNWNFGYNIGNVIGYEAIAKNQKFQYKAFSETTDHNPKAFLTFYLEPIAGQSKETCYNEFWSKAVTYPLIEKSSINHQSFPLYEQVTYLYATGSQNANYYFVKNEKCIDVHISVPKGTPNAESLMTEYGKSLKF